MSCRYRADLVNVAFPLILVLLAQCAALKERCPPRKKSIVEHLEAEVEPPSPRVTVDTPDSFEGDDGAQNNRHFFGDLVGATIGLFIDLDAVDDITPSKGMMVL